MVANAGVSVMTSLLDSTNFFKMVLSENLMLGFK